MKKLLLAVLVLMALGCDPYRVVEMEDGTFKVQYHVFLWDYDDCLGIWKPCRYATREAACENMKERIINSERYRKAKTIKRIVECD